MSAFGVAVGWDGRNQVDRSTAWQEAIAQLGPDRRHAVELDRCVLAHAAFDTTPEATHERQPMCHPRRDVWLVGDIRIDNRALLRQRLGPGVRLPLVTDADHVLAAYERWGDDLVYHLAGDFAFAIWDSERSKLVLARDQMGIRPLLWAETPDGIVAGTTLRGVMEAGGLDRQPDVAFVAQVLASDIRSSSATVWQGAHRLPAAHRAVFTPHSQRIERYWAPSRGYCPSGFDDAAEAVREALGVAVRDRCRSIGPVGCEVSGGFDSSSVLAFAGTVGPTIGVARVFPGMTCDESAYIDAVQQWCNVPVDRVDATRTPTPDLFADATRRLDLPLLLDMVTMPETSAPVLQGGGRVLLTGQGGDQVLAPIPAMRVDQIRRGHVREVDAWADLCGGPPTTVALALQLVQLFVIEHLGDPGRRSRLRSILARPIERRRHTRAETKLAHLAPFVRSQLSTSAVRTAQTTPNTRWPSTAEKRLEYLIGPYSTFLLDQLCESGSLSGVELRHPYFDLRLVELCLSLPQEHVVRGGHPRGLHAASMCALLPATVLARHDKAEFSPWWFGRLAELKQSELLDAVERVGLVSRSRLVDALEFEGSPGMDPWRAWFALAVSAWGKATVDQLVFDELRVDE